MMFTPPGSIKPVWAINVFGHTANTNGERLADLYHDYPQSSSQEEIFRAFSKPWPTISASAREIPGMPCRRERVFAFGDSQSPSHLGQRTTSNSSGTFSGAGGWAGFHDYGGDLPEVTAALDSMMRDHASEIERVEIMKERWGLLVKKRSSSIDLTVKDSHQ